MSDPSIEQRLSKIEARNAEKETDKAWETSWSRKVVIALLTYLVLTVYMKVIGVSNPFKSAVIPTIGFLLSTLTLSFFKKLWLEYFYQAKK